MVIVLQWLF